MYTRVLVTGGAGFVGSRLCERLVATGHRVISLDNYFTGSRDNHVQGVEYREGHTKDIAALVPEEIDIIYHLGEYSRVEQSLTEPHVVWDLNSAGTFAVLEFWRARKCKLVYAGSSTKFSDGGLGRNLSPYTWSKAAHTELVKNYATWYDLPYAITYFYNVYGPGEIPHGPYSTLLAIFQDEIRRGVPLTVVAPVTQKRNFTHIDDTVEGVLLVGEKGEGDEFGIGAAEHFSILEVAEMFKGDIMMLPEHPGNRMSSNVDTSKVRSLGWRQQHTLPEYIADFLTTLKSHEVADRRVLVFSTTFHPIAGPAEDALVALMRTMPEVQFDVITTRYMAENAESPVANATVYRVGYGNAFDKYLLPYFGSRIARELMTKNSYLFSWSIMASYAALAAVFARSRSAVPLLITLADQRLERAPFYYKLLLQYILGSADQISAATTPQERYVSKVGKAVHLNNRSGDAFANQIRVAYNALLQKGT